ncbi:glutamine synthetase type I [Streptomyces griseoaurantiacus M045]|uniref:Glutamine synthetase type I n=1 Tax=Streptomyces griseoaurantiacus M045 TaxID=996637 RepID=F3NBF6_9ACTN|nr:hypothetical protein [Streptomyces griseoaurantiacus]EGG49615.1 glutamine synthetase type I [Streptomyces griseoaurantiacus M045]
MTDNDHWYGCLSSSRGRKRPFTDATELSLHFLRNKKQEWEEYRSEVTAFELRKSLPVL